MFKPGDPVVLSERTSYPFTPPGLYVIVTVLPPEIAHIKPRGGGDTWTVVIGDLELDAAAVMDQVMREAWDDDVSSR